MITIFCGSFDPAHNGHLNTYLKASKLFHEDIVVCICVNYLKNGLLSIEQRLEIAKSLFPTEKIEIFEDKQSIINLIKKADTIVRGYRNQLDIEETIRIANFYGVDSMIKKLSLIEIDPQFSNISSTKIKEKFFVDKDYIEQSLNKKAIEIMSEVLKGEED